MQQGIILLVEDDPDDAALTIRALEGGGVTRPVAVARDGVEALERILGEGDSVPADPPALVLLDLTLPRVSGLEVLRRIRADDRTSFLPVVILTSSHREQDLIAGYRLGANGFVRKPLDFAKLADAARKMGLEAMVSPAHARRDTREIAIGGIDRRPGRGEERGCAPSGRLVRSATPGRESARDSWSSRAPWTRER